jgi:hypothetical protein
MARRKSFAPPAPEDARVVLAGIVRVFRDLRRGVYDDTQIEAQLQARGLMNRVFGRWMRSITNTRPTRSVPRPPATSATKEASSHCQFEGSLL